MSRRDRLEITQEELDRVEQEKKSASLELSAEELDRVQDRPSAPSGRRFPPVDGAPGGEDVSGSWQGETGKAKALGRIYRVVPTGVVHMALAGLVGALAAWLIGEVTHGFRHRAPQSEVVLRMGLWGAMIAAVMGFCFGAAQDFLNRHFKRASLSGVRWALGSALGGFVGGALGQFFYGLMDGGSPHLPLSTQVLARTIGWGLLGAGLGLGHGGMTWNRKRLFNGLIGGLIGGTLGGFLFDFVGMVSAARYGAPSRLVSFVALGLLIGLMIGLVEHLRREAWLTAESGPMEGKQFILFGEQTIFGSGSKADVILHGDPTVPLQAFQVEEQARQGFSLAVLDTRYPVYHNHAQGRHFRLQNGDRIHCGKHQLIFHEKVVR